MITLFRAVAQPGSALRSGRRGRAFESPHPDKFKASELTINHLAVVVNKVVSDNSPTTLLFLEQIIFLERYEMIKKYLLDRRIFIS